MCPWGFRDKTKGKQQKVSQELMKFVFKVKQQHISISFQVG